MGRDYFIRELGIELLAEACSLSVLRHDELGEPLRIAPHHHDDLIQFDLVRGCRGRVFSSGRWLRFDGDIALVAYRGETHGYSLEPAGDHAAVYNLKIGTRTPIESLGSHPLPRFAPVHSDSVFRIASELSSSANPDGFPHSRAILSLLALLLAWPDRGPVSLRGGAGQDVHPVIEHAVTLIESSLDDPMNLGEIAREVKLSGRQLSRLFERAMGMTPHRYATTRRVDRAKTVLLSNRLTVGEIAELLGFSGHATFTRWFTQHTGLTPRAFRSSPQVF
jgi:AraC-like DNA-binding protein